jgi:MFS family permease
MLQLLAARRFAPLFVTQFLGAFNDNLYKTAMLVIIGFAILRDDPQAAAQMISIAGGVFILPFLLFSSLAGDLSDTVDKAAVARWVKIAEIGIMIVGTYALTHDSIALLMVVLFAMGVHSTFFGPLKYAILPQHLPTREVLAGTGLVEAGTYVAILTGQVAGGLLGANAAWAVVAVAVVGFISSRAIPPAPPEPGTAIDWNFARGSWKLVGRITGDRRMALTVVAVSWFWAMGAVLTALFVPLVKERLGSGPDVATLFLALFSVGVATGSIAVNRLLKGEVSGRHTPAAAVLLSLLIAAFVLAVDGFQTTGVEEGVAAFLAHPQSPAIVGLLFLMAAAAGVFVVPLYAMLQTECAPAERARIIAGNNIVNALFMVVASLVSTALLAAGLSVLAVVGVVAVVNLLAVPLTMKLRAPLPA